MMEMVRFIRKRVYVRRKGFRDNYFFYTVTVSQGKTTDE